MPLIPTNPLSPFAVSAILVGLTLTLAACSTSASTTGSGGLTTTSNSPSATATPQTTTTAAPATTSTSHAYPSDYAGAILTAWAGKDKPYLTQLTSSDDQLKLYATGSPNQHWTSVPSQGAAGSTYYGYYNKSGDWIVLRIDNEAVSGHKWHAGSVQTWDPITFSTDANTYVKAFMDAWINGNKARMVKLSNQAFADHFNGLTTPDASYTIGAAPGGNAAGHAYLEVKDASSDLDVTVVVATPVLGSAGAIKDCNPSCT